MEVKGWKYYHHAAIPNCAPHEAPDLQSVSSGEVWKIDGGRPIFASWTLDFDCPEETDWWYVIKDAPFDISALKAKRRYEINKGIKNFEVVRINPEDHKEALYDVTEAAYSAYPKKYRPTMNKEFFFRDIRDMWKNSVAFGAFSRETNKLCGYALVSRQSERNLASWSLKANPQYEKFAVNAALVEGVLRFYSEFLAGDGYMCDGARSINHETAFQDYLEKYFDFRKAYCKLHVKYNPKIKYAICCIYPLRKFLRLFDFVGIVHQLNSVLKMEEHSVARSKKTQKSL